jgi:hypothetical protein
MPEKRLTEVLEGVVEDCVNKSESSLTPLRPKLVNYDAGSINHARILWNSQREAF